MDRKAVSNSDVFQENDVCLSGPHEMLKKQVVLTKVTEMQVELYT